MSAYVQAGPVERGIPLPARGRSSTRAGIFAALSRLEPGESVFFATPDGLPVVKLQNSVCAAWQGLPGIFTSKQEPGGVRAWRVK